MWFWQTIRKENFPTNPFPFFSPSYPPLYSYIKKQPHPNKILNFAPISIGINWLNSSPWCEVSLIKPFKYTENRVFFKNSKTFLPRWLIDIWHITVFFLILWYLIPFKMLFGFFSYISLASPFWTLSILVLIFFLYDLG